MFGGVGGWLVAELAREVSACEAREAGGLEAAPFPRARAGAAFQDGVQLTFAGRPASRGFECDCVVDSPMWIHACAGRATASQNHCSQLCGSRPTAWLIAGTAAWA